MFSDLDWLMQSTALHEKERNNAIVLLFRSADFLTPRGVRAVSGPIGGRKQMCFSFTLNVQPASNKMFYFTA